MTRLKKGAMDEVKFNRKDIKKTNNHHGKRADAIVRVECCNTAASTATKEPTDNNKLVDEYLRLAYHVFPQKTNLQCHAGD
jgi:hypothetical protein